VLSDTKDTDMHKGIKVIKVPKVVKMALVDFDTDPEYGDISNPEKGFNMIIDRTGEGLDTEYTVKAQRERTSIFEVLQNGGVDPAQLTLHNLDEVHRSGLKSEEDLRGLLEQLKGTNQPRTTAQSFNQPQVDGQPQTVVPTSTRLVDVPDGGVRADVQQPAPLTDTPARAGGPVMSAVGAVEVPEVPPAPVQGGE
jgi:hypothetical protein